MRRSVWVTIALVGLVLAECGPSRPPLDLLVVSLDTVRRDHLSLYDYERETSPRLEALAERSVVFSEAYTQSTKTAPSHASMFTGLYPHQHAVLDNFQRLSPGAVTLAEILQQAGYRSGAFVSGSTMTGGPSGLQRGFEVWDDQLESHRRSAGETVDRALGWLDSLEEGETFFLFVHLYDAHGPYAPPEEYASMFASEGLGPPVQTIPAYQIQFIEEEQIDFDLHNYVDRYDAAIRYLDDQLGRLLEAVNLEQTAVLVVADHGETLGERFWSLDHGGQLFEEQIRIPLVLHLPDSEPKWLDAPVETVDLLPTLPGPTRRATQ